MREGASTGGVLVAGAINTDLVARARRAPEAGETVTGDAFAIFGGGKGANQALAAARSGAPTAIVGAVGDDDFGRARLADLRRDGIDITDVVVTTKAASGVALISLDATGQNRILYVPGTTLLVDAERAEVAIRRVRPSVLLATLELAAPARSRLFGLARELGATTVLNATPEPEEGKDLLGLVDILVVNEAEALGLLGATSDGAGWDQVAAGLQALGPRCVVVTLGSAGALVRVGDGSEKVPAPPVEVVDTTGAGDAFCGALAARLAEGAEVRDAARYGVTAGSLAVTKPGAQPSMPTRAEIEARL